MHLFDILLNLAFLSFFTIPFDMIPLVAFPFSLAHAFALPFRVGDPYRRLGGSFAYAFPATVSIALSSITNHQCCEPHVCY